MRFYFRMKKSNTQIPQPISVVAINRLLVVFVLILALLAGYFHAKADTIQRMYDALERETVQQIETP